ncbi:MAG: cupin domain-containing protein [Nitrosomonas sp.]|nr:cupin domain-containing protein [Nitrosomonas sp.]
MNGLTPEAFLREYWQKKPLLIRNALPGFEGLLTQQELMTLSGYEDAQSRLVTYKNNQWHLKHGPLKPRDFNRLPDKSWSLLVQDVNHFLPAANDLLLKFSFIPSARLDDLMVSFAPAGGGIGPHYDSYDVFLLQGPGRRRWEIAADYDNTLIADAPLKILQHFKAEQTWILEPGDMLYLPPYYAHHGVAVDACMTYSIGFRAPSHQELIAQFLIYLQDHLSVEGWYTDPDLKLQRNPLELSTDMQRQVGSILKKIRWKSSDIGEFLGVYLTEPKAHVFFNRPEQPLSFRQFKNTIQKKSIQLDLKSRILFHRNSIYINGEIYNANQTTQKILSALVFRQKKFTLNNLNNETEKILYQWYVNGYVLFTACNAQ